MDLISLYYFSELAKELHMTHTAERLFISQQTLSNHIRRMEEELGTPLLNRKPSLSLTLAGELVLNFAQKVGRESMRLQDALSDIEEQERGALKIGASIARLNACLPAILPDFTHRYPQVELWVTDAVSSKLEPLVLDGSLDFAIVLSGTNNPQLRSSHLIHDQLYLCVSDRCLRKYYADDAEALKENAENGAFVHDFEKLPFCMMTNRIGQMLQNCFSEAGVIPHVFAKNSYSQLGISICNSGLAACVTSQMNLVGHLEQMPEDVNIFPLRDKQGLLSLPLSLIQLKDRVLPLYAKFFLKLLIQNFSRIEQAPVVHLSKNGSIS